MSLLSVKMPTLLDHTRAMDPDGSHATIAEIMNETNEMLSDIPWYEGNLPTGHRITQRSSLPAPSWRALNEGVVPTKGTTKQVDEVCAMLEDWGECDKDLAMLNGNTAKFRLGQSHAHIEGISQEFADTLFYGDQAQNNKEFTGLTPRFASTTGTTGSQVILANGTETDLTSIWLICWGPRTAYGIFPKGSKAGLLHEDLGEVTIGDSTNGYFQGYRDHFQWKCGIAIEDYRYVVRIANVDISASLALTGTGYSQLDQLMIRAINKIQSKGAGRMAFYCNRAIKTAIDLEAGGASTKNFQIKDYGGSPVTTFQGIPIRMTDALVSGETAVS